MASRLVASAVAVSGLLVGAVATLYIAGTFGLSTATATKLVNAYEVGGWALTIALAVFSGGTAAALLAVLKKYAESMSKKALIA
jgi:circularin A/uberolysin family circular bacteriocin